MGASILPTDVLAHLLQSVGAPADLLKPNPTETQTPNEWVNNLRVRDRVIWAATETWIDQVHRVHHESLIIEGGVWPEFLPETLPPAMRVVFLVDTSPELADRLIHIRDGGAKDSNNWQAERGYTDDYLREWARYSQERSRKILQQGAERHLPVIDLANYPNVTAAQNAAVMELMTNKRKKEANGRNPRIP